MNSQLPKDLPGFPAGLDRDLHPLPGDPARDRDGRVAADPLETVLDHGVDVMLRPRGALEGQFEHILGASLELLAEALQIPFGLLMN